MKKYRDIDDLRERRQSKQRAIRKRLKEYAAVPEQQYFYELVYCLMTPQSSAVNAHKAQAMFEQLALRERDIDPEPVLFTKQHYIRFHRTKSKHIIEMKGKFPSILAVITGPMTAPEKREWLVKNVKGLSDKEATHFLRNIGKNEGLAILDRHILKHLVRHRVIGSIPATLTRKRYRTIERKFQRFADAIGIPIDELDLVFWSNETGEILK